MLRKICSKNSKMWLACIMSILALTAPGVAFSNSTQSGKVKNYRYGHLNKKQLQTAAKVSTGSANAFLSGQRIAHTAGASTTRSTQTNAQKLHQKVQAVANKFGIRQK